MRLLRHPLTHAVSLLLGSATQDLAFRLAQVALPLVVLGSTGSVALTGLVAGAEGVPVLLSPWWARRARQWVGSGRRLACLAVLDAAALSVVPAAALLGVVSAGVLLGAGLLLGVGETLGGPGRAALLAEVGDRLGADRAITLLTWQDLLRRVGMLVGPGLGAAGVALGFTTALLWVQAATVLVAGLLAWPVPGGTPAPAGPGCPPTPAIRSALVGRPEVLVGWVLRGTNSAVWFAFTLGLAVLGAQQGRPGVLYAWGMTGYGAGSVVGTLLAVPVVRRGRVLAVVSTAWTAAGAAWVLMGVWPTPFGAGLAAAAAGASVVVGITAVNAAITRTAEGAVRRTLLSGQAVVVSASSSVGMLLGGAVLGLLGVRSTLVASGLLVSAVSLAAPRLARRSGAQGPDPRVEIAPVVAADHGLDDLDPAVGVGQGVLELRE
ncbi:hypothetical protein BJZ21_003560 [Nocardioides panaciterrulae]|uniref:MFS transporter n=1 Tax=Nocardioides panaciterrulae TaxID=661492 RepID=A0A7Y9JC39_9ACTN|nr:hypothetical protein [Nocardioides panaciterrulae]